jgi:hypothetical protein
LFSPAAQTPSSPLSGEIEESRLPLNRVVLYSSGVGYFEHRFQAAGPLGLSLSFDYSAINDVLKSLTIFDPASAAVSVRYPSEQTLSRTLESLGVSLPGFDGGQTGGDFLPVLGALLQSLRGAEIQIPGSPPLSGRILSVSGPGSPEEQGERASLLLLTPQGIRRVFLDALESFSFTDPEITGDLNRALDLIAASRDSRQRRVNLSLPRDRGTPNLREVRLSYVIPCPVWKVSYRLDLGERALFQGWALVDNDGSRDWEDVELTLVGGRPVSFIQELYPPYYLARPVLPLAIAGYGEARVFGAGTASSMKLEMSADMAQAESLAPQNRALAAPSPPPSPAFFTATPSAAPGGQDFSLVLPRINLARHQSLMVSLVSGEIQARPTLILTASGASTGENRRPARGAELVNTLGLGLPAGPVTVFQEGLYGGDALLDFLPPGDRRMISFGEDLSVSASWETGTGRFLTAIRAASGVMTVRRKIVYTRTYRFRSAAEGPRRLVLEHPRISGAVLTEPAAYEEMADSLYRFVLTLPPGASDWTIKEESPVSEQLTLTQIRPEALLHYASNEEFPPFLREIFRQALELRGRIDTAAQALNGLEGELTRLLAEETRIRANLEAAGNQIRGGEDSPGALLAGEYLKRLEEAEQQILGLSPRIEAARTAHGTAQKTYETYLLSLEF